VVGSFSGKGRVVREVPVCWEEVRSELEPGTERIVGVGVVVVRGMSSG
jgi:hypothetical protein